MKIYNDKHFIVHYVGQDDNGDWWLIPIYAIGDSRGHGCKRLKVEPYGKGLTRLHPAMEKAYSFETKTKRSN